MRGSKSGTRDLARGGFEVGNNVDLRVYSAERVIGNVERSLRLPEFVDGDKMSPPSSPMASCS